MPRLAIDRDFLREYAELEKHVQQRVEEVFAKFDHATHTGLHLEKITGARDPRFGTIRIDRFWRGVVIAPDSGDIYTLLKVLPHDDAYTWARRRTASVNSATGRIEIRDSEAIDTTLPQLQRMASGRSAADARLFAGVSDADMRRLGVDPQMLALARALTDPVQLEAAQGFLPAAQWQVLYGLASGMSPEAVWDELGAAITGDGFDPEDLDAAVRRSPDRVVLVDGPQELMAVFARPFDLWRVYLHPLQREAAEARHSGPARVTGGPGTGKTVVALHRARALAERAEGPVLVTTFTSTLADSLAAGMKVLAETPKVLDAVTVEHIDRLAHRIFREVHGPVDQRQRTVRLRPRAVPGDVFGPGGAGQRLPGPAEPPVADHRAGLPPGEDHRRRQERGRGRRDLQPGQQRRHQAVQGRLGAGQALRGVARRPPRDERQPAQVEGGGVLVLAGLAAAQRDGRGHRTRPVQLAGGCDRRGTRDRAAGGRRPRRHLPRRGLGPTGLGPRPGACGPLRGSGDRAAAQPRRQRPAKLRPARQAAVLVPAGGAARAVQRLYRVRSPGRLRRREAQRRRRADRKPGAVAGRSAGHPRRRLRGVHPRVPLLPLALHAHPRDGCAGLRQRAGAEGRVAGQAHLAGDAPHLPQGRTRHELPGGPGQRHRQLLLPDPEVHLEIGKREPEDYFAEVEERHPGVLASQWIPTDPELWRVERYPDFLRARRELLAQAAREFLDELRDGAAAGGGAELRPLKLVTDTADDDPRAVQIRELIEELQRNGCVEPLTDAGISDPDTGRELAVAEAFWPDGLQPGQGRPLVLELDSDQADLQRLKELDYDVFTSPDALLGFVNRQHADAPRSEATAEPDAQPQGAAKASEPDTLAEGEPLRGFGLAMRDLYQRARDETGYRATYFLGMLADIGPLETARRLLNAPAVSDGFAELWERGRLDLTVEALALQERFAPLFTQPERTRARTRLEQFGYAGRAGGRAAG